MYIADEYLLYLKHFIIYSIRIIVFHSLKKNIKIIINNIWKYWRRNTRKISLWMVSLKSSESKIFVLFFFCVCVIPCIFSGLFVFSSQFWQQNFDKLSHVVWNFFRLFDRVTFWCYINVFVTRRTSFEIRRFIFSIK